MATNNVKWALIDAGPRITVSSWEAVQPIFEKLGHTFSNKYFCRPNGDPRTNANAEEGKDYFSSHKDYRKYLCANGVDYIGILDEADQKSIAYWVRFHIFTGSFEEPKDDGNKTNKCVCDLRLGKQGKRIYRYIKLLMEIGYTYNSKGINNGYLLLVDPGEKETYLSKEELWIHLGKHGLYPCTFEKFDTKDIHQALEIEIMRRYHGRYGNTMFL